MTKRIEREQYHHFLEELREEDMGYLEYLHEKEERRGHWKIQA